METQIPFQIPHTNDFSHENICFSSKLKTKIKLFASTDRALPPRSSHPQRVVFFHAICLEQSSFHKTSLMILRESSFNYLQTGPSLITGGFEKRKKFLSADRRKHPSVAEIKTLSPIRGESFSRPCRNVYYSPGRQVFLPFTEKAPFP